MALAGTKDSLLGDLIQDHPCCNSTASRCIA